MKRLPGHAGTLTLEPVTLIAAAVLNPGLWRISLFYARRLRENLFYSDQSSVTLGANSLRNTRKLDLRW
ncbi:hypothetical protein AGR7C_Cc110421 [Agrobacterium deltaense Zutra 3/1]|uniref:Uncharacterized protein n=1 Tax=Agrobacterium deltaense Zutra 3/1 TaxID=1183427 RepID=A0A1S7P6M3_9HYPH|nr:hypothetical protein AGR7C_Cc110421 [Agrobacterium deltaense Zutra 3/1]